MKVGQELSNVLCGDRREEKILDEGPATAAQQLWKRGNGLL